MSWDPLLDVLGFSTWYLGTLYLVSWEPLPGILYWDPLLGYLETLYLVPWDPLPGVLGPSTRCLGTFHLVPRDPPPGVLRPSALCLGTLHRCLGPSTRCLGTLHLVPRDHLSGTLGPSTWCLGTLHLVPWDSSPGTLGPSTWYLGTLYLVPLDPLLGTLGPELSTSRARIFQTNGPAEEHRHPGGYLPCDQIQRGMGARGGPEVPPSERSSGGARRLPGGPSAPRGDTRLRPGPCSVVSLRTLLSWGPGSVRETLTVQGAGRLWVKGTHSPHPNYSPYNKRRKYPRR